MCWEFDKRSKHFLLDDHFINSHNLISWQSMVIVVIKTVPPGTEVSSAFSTAKGLMLIGY